MRHRIQLLALFTLSLLMLPVSARADGISYAYTFTNFGGNTFSFTVPSLITTAETINISPFTVEGLTFTSANVTFLNPTEPCFTFTGGTASGSCTSGISFGTPPYGAFLAPFKNAVDIGTFSYSGGLALCSDCNSTNLELASLTISTTPEPSSLILLGTGLIGLAAMVRRKFKLPTLTVQDE